MAEILTKSYTKRKLTPHFPDDILILIFLKLPPRSLFLFRSVSKHWLRLLQNPTFINNHRLVYQLNHNSILAMRIVESHAERKTKTIFITLLTDDETLPYQEEVPLENISSRMASRKLFLEEDRMHLLGPCNGVFCVTDTENVVLINPTTRQCRNVARSPFSRRRKGSYRRRYVGFFDRVGFGFDSVENDYKVVWFHDAKVLEDEYNEDGDDDDDDIDLDGCDENTIEVVSRNLMEKYSKPYVNDDHNEEYDDQEEYSDDDVKVDNNDGGHDYPRGRRMKVEIFSFRTNRWRKIDSVMPAWDPTRVRSHNLFFNGAFHWLSGVDEDVCSILAFDLNKEVFKVFGLPDYYQDDDDIDVYLSVMNESLGMIVHRKYDHDEIDVEYEIWVMKEYGVRNSWRELYNIRFDVGIERPLSFGKKRELLVENDDGKLASFNLKTKKNKEFEVHGVPGSVQAFRYRESLVSLY